MEWTDDSKKGLELSIFDSGFAMEELEGSTAKLIDDEKLLLGLEKEPDTKAKEGEVEEKAFQEHIDWRIIKMAGPSKAKLEAEMIQKIADAEGDLDVTSKVLSSDVTTLEGLRKALSKAQNFEPATKSLEEELKALAQAKSDL